MIHFAQPQYLWLLALVALSIGVVVYSMLRRRRVLRRFASRQMLPLLHPEASPRRLIWVASFRIFAMLCVVIALARPQLKSLAPLSTLSSVGVDVSLCVDVSNSMWAEDIRPNRITFARQVMAHTLHQLRGSRVALVVFAGGAYIRLPLTSDLNLALDFLVDIEPGMLTHQGTNIAQALQRSAQTLSAPSVAGKAIILLTDGENHEEDPTPIVEQLKHDGIRVYSVTIGSEGGGTIPLRDGTLLTDSIGKPIISHPDRTLTEQIAHETGGESFTGSSPRAIGDKIIEQLRTLPQANLSGEGQHIEELYAYPLVAALVFLLLGWGTLRRKSRLFRDIKMFGSYDV